MVGDVRSPKLRVVFVDAAQRLLEISQGQGLSSVKRSVLVSARATILDLLYGILREQNFYQSMLGELWVKPPADAIIEWLLICALHRLRGHPDRAYVIVNEAVLALEVLRLERYRGMVNAILRRFLREQGQLEAHVQQQAAVKYRLPAWWLSDLQRDWPEHWVGIAEQSMRHPPMALRVNRRQGLSQLDYQSVLAAQGIISQVVGEDALLLPQPVSVESLPFFQAGQVSVQDIGAQYAARALSVEAGHRVLDACAAPGGKAAHILELCDVDLLALDVVQLRCDDIVETLHRLKLSAQVDVCDATRPETWWDGRVFDRILLDAPCSASGVARRYPDAKWLRRQSDIRQLSQQQLSLLSALWSLLAPGGTLLYVTCSVFCLENDDVIARFLSSHSDVTLLDLELPSHLTCVSTSHGVQLLPSAIHDGFFYCGLLKHVC